MRWTRWKIAFNTIIREDLPSFSMADEEESCKGAWEFYRATHNARRGNGETKWPTKLRGLIQNN